jgi:bifunctional non-homologous end joining protein LigD
VAPSRSKRGQRLAGYEGKRDFDRSPEPPPGSDEPLAEHEGLPRFVIHQHSARRLHWDLRLEHEGTLASWAVPKGMPEEPGENRFAARTEDHPLEYLSFHGEIPAGSYGAGTMAIWDEGTYEPLKWEPRKVEVLLHGQRLQARYALFAISEGAEPKEWMVHRMDPPAEEGMQPMPERVLPMLARSGELPSDDEGWAFEIKWDGVRAIANCSPGEVHLQSRNVKDITASYPEVGRIDRALGSHRAVLDGEMVAFDAQGRPSFEALQQRMHVSSREQARRLAKTTPATYVIFDLLWLDGHSLTDLPYSERRARLAKLGLSGESWQTPEHVVGHGKELLAASAEQHLEGIVAKRLDSPYEPGGRSGAWLKIKTMGRQELVIGGWLPGKGRRRETIGALLMGVYEPGGVLRYAGRVGTGFSDAELARLRGKLAALERATSPFQAGERPPREAVFCEPELVAEVAFSQWTKAGIVRQASYKGLREDKRASEVVLEDASAEQARAGEDFEIEEGRAGAGLAKASGRELKLSNLGKVLYPEAGFTKRQLINYYAAVAPVILPHLQGRPLTVVRWPDGVQGKSFFQKQSPAHRPEWVHTATVPASGKPIDYTLAEDLPTLVWLANLAAIELHVPLARADAIDRPGAVVFDLDPGAPAGVLECARVALSLQGMFEHLGLRTLVKTSGSKGLQVYIPLNDPAVTYEQTKPFARAVAELLEAEEPELVVSRMTKTRREGRVLIDWSQNDEKKTTVCAYSLRATERPTVSTPLEWQEVRQALEAGEAERLRFEADGVLARVAERGDLMAGALSLTQRLPTF